jgi:hypothetical protein
MEPLHTVVQQGRAHKPLTPLALLASHFYLGRTLLDLINAVLIATSKTLKQPLSFNLLERVIIRGFQIVPI